MTRAGSRPDLIPRLLAGLARQLELPLFGGGGATQGPRPTQPLRPMRPTPPSNDPKPRQIRLGERMLDYRLRRARRKTIGFTIGGAGLTVAAPHWVGVGEIERLILERQGWILTRLAELQRRHAAIPRVRWEDGGTLPYLGRPIVLRVTTRASRGAAASFDPDGRMLTLALPPFATAAQVRARAEAWLQDEARRLFRERLALYEARLGVAHRSLRLSSAKTRWGSCSTDGRILLHWRLIHFPLSSIDYVVAHELAHLKEMNHGPRFWATVATLLPDYEAARSQLKNPPVELMPTL